MVLETRSPVTVELPTDLRQIPDCPAVFLVRVRQGAPYLARTSLLRRRLERLLGERGRPSRLLNLRSIASRLEYWPVGSRLESSLLLYELAKRHFPADYSRFLKLRLPPYLKVILSNPFPRTQVTTRLSGAKAFYYGPFRNRAVAEQFSRQVLDLFQVRRCQEDLEPSPLHPGCVYGEMNMCLRPCQAAVSREEYLSEVDRLVQFLATGGRSLLGIVTAARDRLSEEMHFEEAARQHKRLEKIQQVLRLRDDLGGEVGELCGVAVTASAVAGAAELWFFCRGGWQAPVRISFEVVDGKPVSLDHRLREAASALQPVEVAGPERQEHLALLVRWYCSSWRDGEWVRLAAPDRLPYRKLVAAVARVLTTTPPPTD